MNTALKITGVVASLLVVGGIVSILSAPSRVVQKTLETNNIITSYEWFYDVNAQYDARVNQLLGHKALVMDSADTKEKSRLNMELAAMRQSCRELATKYNANSNKMNKQFFKAKELPITLSITNCEN